jgi:hypothetical protein
MIVIPATSLVIVLVAAFAVGALFGAMFQQKHLLKIVAEKETSAS